MKLFNDTPFQVNARRTAFEPRDWFLSVVVKGTFVLTPDGTCQPLPVAKQPKIGAAQKFMDEHGNSRMTDHDLTPYKPRADCLFVGSAWAPGGRPVGGIEVAFGVGEMHKRLAVWGDRFWVRESGGGVRLDGPKPFTEMPIRNEYAHGGPTSHYNRHGIGFGRLSDKPGSTLQAANIMRINEGVAPWDRDEEPAGFGLLAPDVLPRRKLAGTYDSHWLYRRRPLPPRDFDPAFLNGARADQQVDGFLRGDEEIYLEHLHPQYPVLRARLPGLSVRCFVNRDVSQGELGPVEFAEVLTNLDTCVVDATDGLVTLLWRGTLAVSSPKLDRVHHIMVVTEPTGEPESRQFYLDMMNEQVAALQPAKPSTELSDKQKEKIRKMHEKGIEDIVATLRQGKADEALVADVAKQPTVDDALKVMSAFVEDIHRSLPEPPAS